MPTVEWGLICEGVLENPRTHAVTLVDIVDELTLPSPIGDQPAQLEIELFIVSRWRVRPDEPSHGRARFTIRSPAAELLAESQPMAVDLSEGAATTAAGLGVFPLAGTGEYRIELQFQQPMTDTWTDCGVITLPVVNPPGAGSNANKTSTR